MLKYDPTIIYDDLDP